MGEIMIHERENNSLSEEFLKANGERFHNGCITVLRLLYKGMKLTAKQVNDITNMADGGRRLRDIYANRSDVKRQKRYSSNGKLEGMEYWIEIPKQTTKAELVEWFRNYQEEKSTSLVQQSLFS